MMKFINKVLVILLALGIISACENLEMEGLQVDPNNPSPETASLNELYNQIQLDFNQVFTSSQYQPGAAARMYMSVAFIYRNAAPNTAFNGLWGNVYNDLLPDVDALLALAEGQNFAIHTGTAKIMKAYALMVLVDVLGDVPYTEALQGTDVISPSVDDDAAVYAAAIALLDEAIAELTGTNAPRPASDIFYNGNASRWITAANTLKLRAALNTDDVGTINSLTDIIDAADGSEDFQFNYGSQRANPNSRHWMYNNHYEIGDGNYLSNYFMWLLRADKETVGAGVTIVDPRIRYYFYRKVDDAVNQDLTTYSCHFSIAPDQSAKPSAWDAVDPDLPYCVASADGYSGRDHLNGEGIPPDGPIRTSYGLYPGGGDFDDDTFDDTREAGTRGGLGRGINPLMMASYVDFMKAEAVLRLGATGDARALLESGIRKSLDKVESFESLVNAKMSTTVTLRDGSSGTIKQLFGMDQAAKDQYVNDVLAIYDASADRLDVVMKEFLIAAWGNGLEAFNIYRRTAKPENMQPALENPGAFPLSFLYPATSVDRNANISQKADLDVPVFWQNTGVASQLY